jgi:hypothetical protein
MANLSRDFSYGLVGALEAGAGRLWRLADTVIELDIADGPGKGEVFAMRQISLFNAAATRQMHILTWRKGATYRAADDDPTRMVPNPAKKPAYQQVEKARRALHSGRNRPRPRTVGGVPPRRRAPPSWSPIR